MYIINNIVEVQCFCQFNFEKTVKTNTSEILSTDSEKGAFLFEHSLLKYTHYCAVEGKLVFNINQKFFHLMGQQYVSISKKRPYRIKANKNFQFLIT